MRGGTIASLGLAAIMAVVSTTVVSPQQITPAEIAERRGQLQKLLDGYAAGEPIIIPLNVDRVTHRALSDLLGDKTAKWHPARPAFALEFASAWYRAGRVIEVDSVLRLLPGIFATRPTPIGDNAAEDAYELLCHQIAIAIIEGSGSWVWHRLYFMAANPRLVKLEARNPDRAGRIPLMRAVDTLMHCCDRFFAPFGSTTVVVTSFTDGNQANRPTPLDALARFEDAAKRPALRQEALVRGAFLHERQRQASAGLAMLDRAQSSGDPIIDYASALIRGSLLDRKDDPLAAAESYTQAMRLGPGAQTPVIGRAAALLRAGRVDDAVVVAERAKRLPTDGVDPLTIFFKVDARFIEQWMVEMRKLWR